MIPARLSAALLLALLLAPACDSGDPPADTRPAADDAKATDDDKANLRQIAEDEAKAKTKAGKEDDEDRGTATVTIDGTPWTAESCKARPRKNGALKVTCSTVDMNDGKVDRVALDIVLPDYAGPGEYKAANFGTTFSGVGFDAKAATEGKDEDDAAKDAIKAGMKGAKIHMLGGMPVTVTRADDRFIDGTFSFDADATMKTPAFKDGTFHARRSEKKK